MMFDNHQPSLSCTSDYSPLSMNMFNFKHQFEFYDKHSTFISFLVENLVNAIDNGKSAACILLDFQKAFATIDHCILLDKLIFYGGRGRAFDWFSNYLNNCQQLTNHCGYESDLKEIKCEVPHWAILWHLFLVLYANALQQLPNII